MNWLRRLFSKKYRDKLFVNKSRKTEAEFEHIFVELSLLYPLLSTSAGQHIEEPLGEYMVIGGWLTDTCYLDIYKKDKKMGRIIVGPPIFDNDPPIWWIILRNSPVSKVVLNIEAFELTRTDLARAINAIVPELVEDSNSGNR